LKTGLARYGLMLNEQGVIIDDGVFVRMAEHHYLVHTTSGGAERIAAMMEEWRQCEWPSLEVIIVPVTHDWAIWTVSGPLAAATLARAGTDLMLGDFPHMTWRNAQVAGLPVRVLRASFTGEASYEISVAADRATDLGDALAEAGSADGLTLYGIEALMTMRIEKGFIHVGVDTDGTTLPDDVGMAGGVARKASDFIGRRSLIREDAIRPDRLQLVGLESEDLLPVGAHVLAGDAVPGESDGHVTSAAWSPTMDRPVALALLRGGRSRLGETVTLYDMGKRYRATLIAPGVYDPAGGRLRG
jgi:sarcosine oxidase subunit alpha